MSSTACATDLWSLIVSGDMHSSTVTFPNTGAAPELCRLYLVFVLTSLTLSSPLYYSSGLQRLCKLFRLQRKKRGDTQRHSSRDAAGKVAALPHQFDVHILAPEIHTSASSTTSEDIKWGLSLHRSVCVRRSHVYRYLWDMFCLRPAGRSEFGFYISFSQPE